MSYWASPLIICVVVRSSHSSMVPFSPWRFSFLNLAKFVVSVGSDSLCRDGAFVIICPHRPWSLNIGLPMWTDEIHGYLGVVFWTFFSFRKGSRVMMVSFCFVRFIGCHEVGFLCLLFDLGLVSALGVLLWLSGPQKDSKLLLWCF